MTSDTLRILIIGAHPDDPEFGAGGVAALYSRQGHRVKMVTLTNGEAGHHEAWGEPLAQRRREEGAAAGACLGAEYLVLDNRDETLLPTLEVRYQVITIMREFRPDLVMTHRPYDYHPDHRYTSQVVQDSLVPVLLRGVLPDVPALPANPVVVYTWDRFQKPCPFIPDVVVSIDDVVEKKVDALHCHVSQMYESMPYYKQIKIPEDPSEWRSWLRERFEGRLSNAANLYRDRLVELYGEEKGRQIKYAEAFEACEYGTSLSDDNLKRLFPFLGAQ